MTTRFYIAVVLGCAACGNVAAFSQNYQTATSLVSSNEPSTRAATSFWLATRTNLSFVNQIVLYQSRGFRPTAHDVKALDRLAASPFHKIIFRAHNHQAPCPRIEPPGDFNHICPDHIFGVGQRLALEQADKWLPSVGSLVAF